METTIQEKKITIKDLLPCKSFMIILIANFISRFGDSLDSIAYSWMIYTLTGSKLLMGTILALNAVPNIIFSPFVGPIIDRLKKKDVVVVGFLGRGIVVSITALMFMFGILKPWHLFVFTFIISTFETITGPAHSALVPLLLPKELYLTANSFSTSAYKFAELIGLGAAGIIIAVFKISGAIFIDGMTFFAAAFLILIIKVESDTIKNEPFTVKAYFSELKEGFVFIGKEKVILITIILFAIVNFCISPLGVFMPILTKDILKGGPELLSILGIAITLGTIIGGVVVGQFGSRFKISTLTILSFILLGITYSLLYLPGTLLSGTSAIIVVTSLFAIMGFLIPAASSPISAYIMTYTPKEIMGRVSSVLTMITFCAIPLGSATAGIFSEYISMSVLFLIMGIIIISASILVSFNKKFRKA